MFTAIATGINKKNFTYQWKKKGNGNLLNKVSGVNGAVLEILNSLKSDEGQYYCNVTNEWGRSVKSNDANLTVIGKWLKFIVEKLHVLTIVTTLYYSWSTSD